MSVRPAAALYALLAIGVLASPARAEWMDRTEAIMGTRVYVELWSEIRPPATRRSRRSWPTCAASTSS